MPLYLGLDAGALGLTAIIIDIQGDLRRVVFNGALNFDRGLAECATAAAPPLILADTLDRMMGRLAATAEIEVEDIRAISGSSLAQARVDFVSRAVDSNAFKSSIALARQLEPGVGPSDLVSSYLQGLLAGSDDRLASYWQKRYALPNAAIVPWADDRVSRSIGMGVIHEGVLGIAFGTTDVVSTSTTFLSFRNGEMARELMRMEHRLEWDAVARLLEESPGNAGWVMLPWVELETTPPIAHAGVRRFGFDRHNAARNMRSLIEGQMMAMANHVQTIGGAAIEKVLAIGDAAAHRAILQVMANVFGAEVYRLETEYPAALGAALRAYHADRLVTGDPVSWTTVVSGFTDPKPGHRVSPNPKHTAMYAWLRKDYAMLERLHQDRAPIC